MIFSLFQVIVADKSNLFFLLHQTKHWLLQMLGQVERLHKPAANNLVIALGPG